MIPAPGSCSGGPSVRRRKLTGELMPGGTGCHYGISDGWALRDRISAIKLPGSVQSAAVVYKTYGIGPQVGSMSGLRRFQLLFAPGQACNSAGFADWLLRRERFRRRADWRAGVAGLADALRAGPGDLGERQKRVQQARPQGRTWPPAGSTTSWSSSCMALMDGHGRTSSSAPEGHLGGCAPEGGKPLTSRPLTAPVAQGLPRSG